MTKSIGTALLAVVFVLLAPPVVAQDAKLGVAQREAVQDVAASMLTAIYERAGLTLQIDGFPAARLTNMVLKNEIDGEVSRIGIYFERNPGLIKVEPAYYRLITTAFARTERNLAVGSVADLKKYRVGIIRGVYHAATATEGVPGVVVVDDVVQLFRMLESGRIDIALDVEINGADMIKQLNLGGTVKAVGEVARRDLFHVLIPGKKNLAPRISVAIKSMTSSGELAALIKKFEADRVGAQNLRRY